MTASFPRLLLSAMLATGLVLGVAACGKKGNPKPPEGEASQYTYPQPYPAPKTVVPGGTEETEPGQEDPGPLWMFNGNNRTTTKTY